jgi:hypothetical protein
VKKTSFENGLSTRAALYADHGELHRVRKQVPELQAAQRATQGGEILMPPHAKRIAKDSANAELAQLMPGNIVQ